VSPSRAPSALSAATEAWRPMAFGTQRPRQIKDALCEPLWGGERVFVDVAGHEVHIRDVDGDELEGYDDLRAAIAESAVAGELLLDGYLLPAPLRETRGAEALPGSDATPTARQMGMQLLLGRGGVSKAKEARKLEDERHVELEPSGPAAFVAVDVLWLDGEPLLDVPLLERKRLLESVLLEHELVRRTMLVRPPVEPWFGQWRALGFREFALKGANSRYRPGSVSPHWATAQIPRR
jgi:ATP-dependent DNA ligase